MYFKLTGTLILSTLLSYTQTLTNKIVVDQFGYRPSSSKTAVVRNPITGADASETYSPGNTFAVVKVSDGSQVFTDVITQWNGGNEDASSGDKAWWFDFSSVTNEGEYYILDIANNKKSFTFEIKDDVYNVALKHALRVFFYQRSGHEKLAQHAGANWADGASHVGPLQDKNCRKWDAQSDASTEKDVHGGWYDAGDLNKYTTWTGNYALELLRAYSENPNVWTDDLNIPESGNGIPDIIDEVKWGMDHLLRLQNSDGSVISLVTADGASPPSAASGASYYGNVNTSSALSTSGVFAYGSKVFKALGLDDYADTLEVRAKKAWDWAVVNPAVEWNNNNDASGTKGFGGGDQEVDDYGRLKYKIRAATYLYDLTSEATYKTFVESNYQEINMFKWTHAYPFESEIQDVILDFAAMQNVTANVVSAINTTYNTAMGKTDNFAAISGESDPYKAHLKDYTWGSSKHKCSVGLMYWKIDYLNLDPSNQTLALTSAEDYIHYMHGVNPMNLVYLTNMGAYGAENSANQIYHTWFHEGTDWDDASTSLYGPAPGIVPGGANTNYAVDGCCPSGCGSVNNNAKCTAVDLSTLLNQPKQKSYLDFNQSWPLNSWEVTENSMGYQAEYIRLLSKFVSAGSVTNSNSIVVKPSFGLFPNPTNSWIRLMNANGDVQVTDVNGKLVMNVTDVNRLDVSNLKNGVYFVTNQNKTIKLIKR